MAAKFDLHQERSSSGDSFWLAGPEYRRGIEQQIDGCKAKDSAR